VEAAGEVLLSAALLALWARRPRPGTVAAAYLAGYGLLRAALEPFRGDSTYLAGLPLAQVWALLALALGVAFLAGLHFRGRAAASPRRSTIGAPE
jgi:prolipoprotein diacylglyceryltransferase